MTKQNETRKEWKKPTVKTIANVRKTRGGSFVSGFEAPNYRTS